MAQLQVSTSIALLHHDMPLSDTCHSCDRPTKTHRTASGGALGRLLPVIALAAAAAAQPLRGGRLTLLLPLWLLLLWLLPTQPRPQSVQHGAPLGRLWRRHLHRHCRPVAAAALRLLPLALVPAWQHEITLRRVKALAANLPRSESSPLHFLCLGMVPQIRATVQ